MDDPKVTTDDDEFKFTEAEEVNSDMTLSDENDLVTEKKSKFNRRNVLIAIGIIIIAFALYKLIGTFFETDNVESKAPSAPVNTDVPSASLSTQQAPVSDNEPMQPQMPSQISPPPSSQLTKALPLTSSNLEDSNEVNKQSSPDAATSQQIQTLKEQLVNLNSSFQNTNQTIDSINQQLQEISTELSSQQVAINQIENRLKPKKKVIIHKPRRKLFVLPKWHIQALIPGRAWLVQANNVKTITVQVGDVLKGYGKIQSISVVNGVVKTSSGAIIRFKNL